MVPRTTINIDATILSEVKRLSQSSGKPLGQLISELVAQALAGQTPAAPTSEFDWVSQPMGSPLVKLEDKQSVYELLDSE
jgi:hypothetical protein